MRHYLLSRIAGIFFALCALVQWNDPDPWLWISVYMMACIIMELASRDIFYPSISLLFLIISMVGAVFLFPTDFQGFFGDMHTANNIEEARESIGLMLISLSQMYLFLYTKKNETDL